MSSAEDDELREKISKLSSRIQTHKQAQSYGAPYGSESSDEKPASDTPSSPFISKTDRHMQLINRNIYERETQQRAQAIEQTLKQKEAAQDHREKAHLAKSLQQAGVRATTAVGSVTNPSNPASRYEVDVEGVRFHVTKQGSKLVKAPDDLNPPSATPKVADIFGVKFHRTKNGNLVRQKIVQAQQRAGAFKKVDEQCTTFSWTGTCAKGPSCRYIHDISKTAVCRNALKGECSNGDNCNLSHDLTEKRTPLCIHYAHGKCTNPACAYLHVEYPSSAPVCRAFGIYGYCDKGASCPDRHVFECPDFSNTGHCKIKGCKRLHIEKASIMRERNQRTSSGDVSSDDSDGVDSDDVDSDEVEEFIGQDDNQNLDLAEQKDFIEFN
ncbi:hypothetical protein F5Y16DRAFT_325506 [Xylariaceae sp. FL0255]|nr:hypothetical protein F5Y16DRAFT_325506 [Xylariaceae sp. FL0255]